MRQGGGRGARLLAAGWLAGGGGCSGSSGLRMKLDLNYVIFTLAFVLFGLIRINFLPIWPLSWVFIWPYFFCF